MIRACLRTPRRTATARYRRQPRRSRRRKHIPHHQRHRSRGHAAHLQPLPAHLHRSHSLRRIPIALTHLRRRIDRSRHLLRLGAQPLLTRPQQHLVRRLVRSRLGFALACLARCRLGTHRSFHHPHPLQLHRDLCRRRALPPFDHPAVPLRRSPQVLHDRCGQSTRRIRRIRSTRSMSRGVINHYRVHQQLHRIGCQRPRQHVRRPTRPGMDRQPLHRHTPTRPGRCCSRLRTRPGICTRRPHLPTDLRRHPPTDRQPIGRLRRGRPVQHHLVANPLRRQIPYRLRQLQRGRPRRPRARTPQNLRQHQPQSHRSQPSRTSHSRHTRRT